ncbi:hypothetical protein H181DRAFT_03964 [Streptomyces sp. WMMB 714]|nr:hypothetical protein H181DRAFT_03964 [Streptomyces sp. WMMB 714]
MSKSVSRRAVAAVAAASAVLLLGGTDIASAQTAAQASGSESGTVTSSVRTGGTDGDVSTKRTRWAKCTGTVNNPHWSKGGKSVIFKTRLSCKGNIPRVHVRVRGQLLKCPGLCPPSTVATSDETKTVAVNGGNVTYYTPKPKGKKIRGDGSYQGKVTMQITSPFPGTKGSAGSKLVKVDTP